MLSRIIRKEKRTAALTAAVLAVVMVLTALTGLLPSGVLEAQAAVTQGTSGHVSDGDTRTNWMDVLDIENNSTRYSGRVWTDKTVSTGSMTFEGDVASAEGTIENNSDFLVCYSALAISQEVVGWPPTDTVFILDFSASMCWNNWDAGGGNVGAEDGSDSRIKYMVDALNEAIDTLAKASPFNRIAIVTFNATADTLLDLQTVEVRPDKDYLELQSFTGTTGADDGVATVRCNINGRRDVTASVTNIQTGLYQGMSILAQADTTAAFGGETVTRIPNVVLMSDGAPTTFAPAEGQRELGSEWNQTINSGDWWNGVDNRAIGYGDNNNPHSGNGFMTLLTASYMKNAITEHYYGSLDTGQAANVYTIGFGIGEQTAGMVEMSNLVLNPAANMDSAENQQVQDVIDAWERYSSGSGRVEVEGLTPSSNGQRPPFTYVVERANDSLNPTTLEYPTEYFAAEDSAELNEAFTQIAQIITEQAKVPTRIWGQEDETESGYITYTDPIGQYMEVKDVKTILLGGQRFDRTGEPAVSGNVATYTFTGQVESAVYGTHDVSEINITVTTDSSGMQTLRAEIPASVIPVRVNTIQREADGSITNTHNNVYPIRILYEIGVKDGVINDSGTLNTDTDTGGVSQAYIDAHSDGNGGVYFYANLYSGSEQGTGDDVMTVGEAYTTFTPARDNPFYFVQEATALYTDPDCRIPAASYNQDATYYFRISYYDNDSRETAVVSRSADLMDGYTYVYNGQLYLRAGAPRLGNLLDVVDASKSERSNRTQTADALIYPIFEGQPSSGNFKIFHGNNGRLQINTGTPASLTIEKTVETDPQGITAPDEDFTFQVTLEDKAGETVNAVKTAADGTTASVSLVFNSSGTAEFSLKDGESLKIDGLSAGTSYTVVENDIPQNFAVQGDAARNGTLNEGENTISFVNVYTAEGSITITKRDGNGGLLEGAGFTLYDADNNPVTVDENGRADPESSAAEVAVYLAEKIVIQPDNLNYDAVRNRYTDGAGIQYIVHRTQGLDGQSDTLFYYRKLTEEEIQSYHENPGAYTDVEAVAEFSGLELNTYRVEETTVPDGGYIKAEDINVTIGGGTEDYYDYLYTVENHKGLILPTTGLNGIGLITAAGVILLAGGSGYFILRRKKAVHVRK